MQIALGTVGQTEFRAVREACDQLHLDAEIVGVHVETGLNKKCVGDDIFQGAFERAKKARDLVQGAIGLGIQSGLFYFAYGGPPHVTIEMSIIVMIVPDKELIVASTQGRQLSEKSRDKGDQVELNNASEDLVNALKSVLLEIQTSTVSRCAISYSSRE